MLRVLRNYTKPTRNVNYNTIAAKDQTDLSQPNSPRLRDGVERDVDLLAEQLVPLVHDSPRGDPDRDHATALKVTDQV